MQAQHEQCPEKNSEHYTLGIFYCNRNDSRVFVPKRWGYGSTLNFAHAASYLVISIPIVLGTVIAISAAIFGH